MSRIDFLIIQQEAIIILKFSCSFPKKLPIVIAILLLPFQSSYINSKSLNIADYMTAKDFIETGLSKLTVKELEKLNSWFTKFTLSIMQNKNTTQNVIESRIDGNFEGWDGDTIFKLENGQIWQQDSYSYTYHYAYRPKVTIIKTSTGRYKMKVDNVSKEIYVKRLK